MPGPVLDFDPQSTSAPDRPQADTRPVPGFLEQTGAAFRVGLDEEETVQTSRLDRAYKPVADALRERSGGDGRTYSRSIGARFLDNLNPFGRETYFDPEKIWRDLSQIPEAERRAAGLPVDRAEFERGVLTRQGGTEEDDALLARGEGAGAVGAQFLGLGGASFADPVNIAGFVVPGAGPAASLGRKMLVDGTVNLLIEGAQMGGRIDAREALGKDTALEDVLFELGGAFVGGAALRGGAEVAPGLARTIDQRLYESSGAQRLREAIDARLSDRDLARAFSRMVPEDLRTPEQEAAIATLTRTAEIDESSPFVETHELLELHVGRMDAALAALEEGRVVSAAELADANAPASPAPSGQGQPSRGNLPRLAGSQGAVAGELSRAGYSDAVVAGFLGNFEVEGGYGGALGDGGTASGIAQWRFDRRANFRKQFGKDPHRATAAEQARFVVWEMNNPGAAGMTVRQRDAILAARTPEEAAALIDRFYERSSGAHRARRQEEARRFAGGEFRPADGDASFEPGASDSSGVDVVRPAALDAQRPDAPLLKQAEFDFGRPELRRDLFDSEEAWSSAQAEIDARYYGGQADEIREVYKEQRATALAGAAKLQPAAVIRDPQTAGDLRSLLRNELRGIELVSADGVRGRITRSSINKIASGTAINRSSSAALHFRAAANIDALFAASTRFAETPDLRALDAGRSPESSGLRSIARTIAAFDTPQGRAAAIMTVKRIRGEGADTLYSIEAIEIRAPDGGGSAPGPENGIEFAQSASAKGDGPGPDIVAQRAQGNPADLAVDQVAASRPRADHSDPDLFADPDPRFDDPQGEGARAAAQSTWHDIDQLELSGEFDLGDGKGARPASEIREELDADRAAIEEIRKCLN